MSALYTTVGAPAYIQPPVTYSTFTGNVPSRVYQPIPLVARQTAFVQPQVAVASQIQTAVGVEAPSPPLTQVGATNALTRIANAPNALVGNVIVGRNRQSVIVTSPVRESTVRITAVGPSL